MVELSELQGSLPDRRTSFLDHLTACRIPRRSHRFTLAAAHGLSRAWLAPPPSTSLPPADAQI